MTIQIMYRELDFFGYRTLCHSVVLLSYANEFLVSKETVVLRRWENSKQKFGFIKRVDKG